MKAMIMKKTISAAAAAMMMLTSTVGLNAFAFEDKGEYDNVFTFTSNSVSASDSDGSGFKINETALTINESGVYVVTGKCSEGSIQIKKGTTDVVLILDNIDLTASDTAPLTVGKEAQVEIFVKGTNTLKDAENLADETSADAEVADAFEGAAIKVKNSATATITGTGTLTVDGTACKNGIKGGTSASVIVGGSSADTLTLNVNAANNGLASDGSVIVNSGNVNIKSTADALKASPDEDDTESAGMVTINGGKLTINGGEDGIQADGGFTMNGGTADITAAGGHTKTVADGGKGIKSDSYITVAGGTLNIDSADDGIHLNGTAGTETISITGGVITVSASDDGIKSDYYLNIGSKDGTASPEIKILQASEGLEGAIVNLWSGKGSVVSSDDGINAANSDLKNFTYQLNIAGGTWYINANGDGVDSNGNMTISGGYTEVFGSPNNGNGALDIGDNGNTLTVTGGTIAGIGMNGMAVVPTSGSYLAFGGSGSTGGFGGGRTGRGGQSGTGSGTSTVNITNGSTIEIKDSQGNSLYSGVGVKSANHVVFTSEALNANETYTLYINGSASGTATVSQGSGQSSGGFGPGQGGWQPGTGTDPVTPPDGGDVTTPPDDGQDQYLFGDVNLDGAINASDVVLLAAHIKSVRTLSGSGYMSADVNHDNTVDVTDLSLVAAHVKGVNSLIEQN